VPTISRFYGITIAMYFDDHGHPHFHARHADGGAKVRIDEVEVIDSTLGVRQLRGLCWPGRSYIARNCWRTGAGHERVRHCRRSSRFDDWTDA